MPNNNIWKGVAVVALVVGILALLTPASAPQQPAGGGQSLGGTYDVQNVAPQMTGGIDFGMLPVHVNWQGDKIGPKQNQASWRNTSGQTVYLDYAEVSTDGTASSSYKFYVYASSTKVSTAYDFTAPGSAGKVAINGFTIATSSAATTTTNVANGAGQTVQVPNGSYVNIVMQSVNGSGCNGTTCETATSTNRGFNLQWRIRYHR